jgi:alpha-galactosidase
MKKITISIIVLLLSFSSQAQKFEELALTPPMGWNSWNKFGCDVSEKLINHQKSIMGRTKNHPCPTSCRKEMG